MNAGHDVHDVLMKKFQEKFGREPDVVAYAPGRVEILGKGGGFILAPCHVLQNDVPTANILALAEAIATSKACTRAGGGDTVSAINVFGIQDKVGYISTAGGAFL